MGLLIGAAAWTLVSGDTPNITSGFHDERTQALLIAGLPEISRLRAQLAERDSEIAALRSQLQLAQLGRMEPTNVVLKDTELPAGKQPSYEELYDALYGRPWMAESNIWSEFPNFYNKQRSFAYPDSLFWQEGQVTSFFGEVAKIFGREWQPRFIVEVGTFFGMSAIRWAQELDRRGLAKVPVLCIDPFSGDLNMWLNKEKPYWRMLDVRHGRPLVYEQFMANVKSMLASDEMAPTHIIPFPATAITAARWLRLRGFHPDTVFLDSSHEIDETYLELALFYRLLAKGGIIFGDDYQWPTVKYDVDRFVAYHQVSLRKDPKERVWAIIKPLQ